MMKKKIAAIVLLVFAALLLIAKWRDFGFLAKAFGSLGTVSYLMILSMCAFAGLNIYSRRLSVEESKVPIALNALSYVGMAAVMAVMAFAGIKYESTVAGQQILKGGILGFIVGLMILIGYFIYEKIREITN